MWYFLLALIILFTLQVGVRCCARWTDAFSVSHDSRQEVHSSPIPVFHSKWKYFLLGNNLTSQQPLHWLSPLVKCRVEWIEYEWVSANCGGNVTKEIGVRGDLWCTDIVSIGRQVMNIAYMCMTLKLVFRPFRHSSCNRLHTFLICHIPSYILFICFCSPCSQQTLISVIMLIPDASSFSSLVDFFSFAAWLFYGGTFASLLWLRYKKPNLNRPYKVSCLSKTMYENHNAVNPLH